MKALDLDVLEMVVAVADAGSFVSGAERVHRSPSAVSMRIKALEESMQKTLFTRTTRSVVLTDAGERLLDYGRRMLEIRDAAWTSVVRPEVKGRVTIGVPDDYASSLLSPVLRKFSLAHPQVELRVLGLPSSDLAPLLKDNALDLACLTRVKGIPGDLLRREPLVWVCSDRHREIWKERPLPIAVYTSGSAARALGLAALQNAKIKFRLSFESAGVMGLVSVLEAGLAIAPMSRCSVPGHLTQLGEEDGLPKLPMLDIVLSRSANSNRPPCDFLAKALLDHLKS
ncbi:MULTISPECIES: LysR family transcriptional regulator [unclassified Achromobacter]|uniref:LysR family transcriptional regulator n=1 Tax=unclassified Achromobacter TaxID=2626865 RepID=UPI000B51B515|nr:MULTISPECIES: LysR substrate-binding domain-containing protein [unclassified Achromobacter]OWT71387.1 LysR family transcriptional regulator [Achromobacter sp. HZ34]OWT73352.1 LysR family transcriptional regulator [Achromobacter sp. HZ28]